MKKDNRSRLTYGLFATWALVALAAIAAGLFAAAPGEPSLALALQLAGVSAAFLLLYRTVPALRRGIDDLDPILLTALQSWRILGMMFLFLMMCHE